MTGQRLSHYQVQEKLGEGGMGVVYRALDTHLDRPVCVKVLRADALDQPERRQRFEREARTASALNHPNIVTIHDIDTAAGVSFIAMEFIKGKTLGQLTPRAGLPLAEALRLAVQIADALAAAHGAGVVHRDLKPANIMVTEGGLVKILDFGLAKLTEHEPAGEAQTVDIAPTEEGTILGTAAYMSPEQAEGKRVDARSDIFSFGSVLYEMATGRPAFRGDSKLSTLSAILRDEPQPVSQISAAVPRDLEKIISRCLRKDPARRWQTMADIKTSLEELKEESAVGQAPGLPARTRRQSKWIVAAVIAVTAVGAGVTWWLNHRQRPASTQALVKLTSDSGLTTDPAISRDGRLIAYASDRAGEGNLDIWVRQTVGGDPIRLTRDPTEDREPAFSPDGSRIAFRSGRAGGGIYIVSALGGEERLLVQHGHAPRFSPDGQWVAYRIGESGGSTGERYIEIIPANGGQARRIPTGLVGTWNPIWSPDGKWLLTIGIGPRERRWDVFTVPLAGGPARPTGFRSMAARQQLATVFPSDWVNGSLDFSASSGDATNLWRIAILPDGQVSGEARRLTFGTAVEGQSAVSDSGGLVFSSVVSNSDIWSVPLDAAAGKVTGEPARLTEDLANDSYPSVSSDGTKMAFQTNRAGNFDIWLKDLTTGKESALVSTPGGDFGPRLSGDGARVVYIQRGIVSWIPTAGGAPEKLCEACSRPEDWSKDSRSILFNFVNREEGPEIHLLDVRTKQFTPLARRKAGQLHSPHFSPDNRWFLFHETTGTATRRIWIAPFRGPVEIPESEWIAVTDGSALDREPRWSPDGGLIYFLSERDGFRCVWTQRIDPASKRPDGAPSPVYHSHLARRLIGSTTDTNAAGLRVVPGKLIFAASESTGNIWMLKPE